MRHTRYCIAIIPGITNGPCLIKQVYMPGRGSKVGSWWNYPIKRTMVDRDTTNWNFTSYKLFDDCTRIYYDTKKDAVAAFMVLCLGGE